MKNWAGNHVFAADRIARPSSVAELRQLVADAPRVKALGTRHSFTDIADFPGGVLVDPAGLDIPTEIDAGAATVTVGAAARYGDFAGAVDEAGFALENLASLPHCTVAGSVATATHGSGERVRNLSAAVSGLELVTADGTLRHYTRERDPDVFPGLVVNLGALGVVTRVTLDLVPSFSVRQDGFTIPWSSVLDGFDELQAAGYSVSLFTPWVGDTAGLVLLKRRVDPGANALAPPGFPGATPVPSPPGGNFTGWGVPGPWHHRLPHFRLDSVPSVGEELQSEFFVPRADAVAALIEIRALGEQLATALHVSEIRTVAGDDLWLSPCHGGDRVGIHFTWQPKPDAVAAVLPLIRERLAPFGARPHWAKLFPGDRWPAEHYPELPRFRALADELDPRGAFRNPYLRRHVFGDRLRA
ncbi:FAD-binding protein [Amycolatopsis sp. NBC_00355]|uniref:FAD-binding protein n=1 Tax=Amycolatopsis sp. NBC_00355 TaxID=2975957 RepID=UPI002E2582D3